MLNFTFDINNLKYYFLIENTFNVTYSPKITGNPKQPTQGSPVKKESKRKKEKSLPPREK